MSNLWTVHISMKCPIYEMSIYLWNVCESLWNVPTPCFPPLHCNPSKVELVILYIYPSLPIVFDLLCYDLFLIKLYTMCPREQSTLKEPGKEQRTVCYKNIKYIRVSLEAISSFVLIYWPRYRQIFNKIETFQKPIKKIFFI